MKRLHDYTAEKEKWITFVDTAFYPNNLANAKDIYDPIIRRFGELLQTAKTSQELYLLITAEPPDNRVQLMRIFRKYVSPDTSVEMLKRIRKAHKFVEDFGSRFRPIENVRQRFNSRPQPDEALIALLHEYEDRGEKGYELTTNFFQWFRKRFAGKFTIQGPERAGKGIYLERIFPDYLKSRSVDFIIRDMQKKPLVIGFARYDSDRGGSQEDDRTGGYGNAVTEILDYSDHKGLDLKILFVNEGPGLLLGSMWNDYVALEDDRGRVKVVTLKMLDQRVTEQWIRESN